MSIKEEMVLIQHHLSVAFIHRWLAKAKGYNEEIIEDCFDKFVSLFVAFNRCYNNTTALINARGEIKKMTVHPLLSFKGFELL